MRLHREGLAELALTVERVEVVEHQETALLERLLAAVEEGAVE